MSNTLVLDRVVPENVDEWLNHYGPLIDKKGMISITLAKDDRGSTRLVDLTHAMQSGKVCISYSIYGGYSDTWPASELIFGLRSPRALFDLLNSIVWTDGRYGYGEQEFHLFGRIFMVTRSDRPARRVFSPLALDRFKPLKAKPRKWTVPHALRAIANGQAADLRCNGVYTDDYYFDAASNFRRGAINAPLKLVERIVNSPSGWRAYEGDGVVHLNCHSFDTNSFRLEL